MYKNLAALTFEAHGLMQLAPTTDYQFAGSQIAAQIVLAEFGPVLREYPIVFPKAASLPCALLGIESGKNVYIGQEGQWLGNYIPLSIRRYPLALDTGEPLAGNNEKTYRIGIDTSAPMLNPRTGDALFNHDGSHGPALVEKLEILKAFEQSRPETERFVALLRKHDLLTDRSFLIKAPTGEQTGVTGIQMVDESKLNVLSAETFEELRKANCLPFIYAHLFSIHNLRHGVIGGRYPLPQSPEPPKASIEFDDDMIKFS